MWEARSVAATLIPQSEEHAQRDVLRRWDQARPGGAKAAMALSPAPHQQRRNVQRSSGISLPDDTMPASKDIDKYADAFSLVTWTNHMYPTDRDLPGRGHPEGYRETAESLPAARCAAGIARAAAQPESLVC